MTHYSVCDRTSGRMCNWHSHGGADVATASDTAKSRKTNLYRQGVARVRALLQLTYRLFYIVRHPIRVYRFGSVRDYAKELRERRESLLAIDATVAPADALVLMSRTYEHRMAVSAISRDIVGRYCQFVFRTMLVAVILALGINILTIEAVRWYHMFILLAGWLYYWLGKRRIYCILAMTKVASPVRTGMAHCCMGPTVS
jgi:hypothetical protein